MNGRCRLTRPRGARVHPGPGLWLGACVGAVALLLMVGEGWAGEEPSATVKSAIPSSVQQNLKVMQDIFGDKSAAGSKGGGEVDIKTIQKLLAKERNIKVWESRGKIFLEGRVTSEDMRNRVEKLLGIFGNVVDLTEYQPDMDTFLADMELIKDKIENTLNKSYLPEQAFTGRQEVSVNIINDKIVVSGELNTKEDVEKAIHIANIYNDDVVNNLSVSKQMIEVAAIFAKVKRGNTKTIGAEGLQSAILTLPTITAGPAAGALPSRFPMFHGKGSENNHFRSWEWQTTGAGVVPAPENLLTLEFLRRYDKSAVLARPHLATVNSESADFLAGGERAIPTVTSTTSDVTYKEYGVKLSTTPTLTTEGRIKLTIKLEFSVPEANGQDFITFRHEGQCILSKAQGMVLSGLINEARSRGLSETPFIGKVPILNIFFSKHSNRKDTEDLVLLVIPRVPGAIKAAPYPLIKNTAKAAEDALWIHEPRMPRRLFDRVTGERGEYWKESPVVLIEPAELAQEEGTGDEEKKKAADGKESAPPEAKEDAAGEETPTSRALPAGGRPGTASAAAVGRRAQVRFSVEDVRYVSATSDDFVKPAQVER